jgi:hypothetical protein
MWLRKFSWGRSVFVTLEIEVKGNNKEVNIRFGVCKDGKVVANGRQ